MRVSYELSDEPKDLTKCAICGDKVAGGSIPTGPLCEKHIKEWNKTVTDCTKNHLETKYYYPFYL